MQKDRLLDSVTEGENGDLPDPGIKPGSPALHCSFILYCLSQQGSPNAYVSAQKNRLLDAMVGRRV